MSRRRKAQLAGMAALLLAGCAGDDRPAAVGDDAAGLADIAGRRWTVMAVEPAEPGGPSWPSTGAELIVDAAAKRAAGSSGCNRWSAGIVADGPGELRFDGIATTFMYCAAPAGIMDRERELFVALGSVTGYRAGTDDLVLVGEGALRILLGRAGAATAQRLAERGPAALPDGRRDDEG